MTNTLPDKYIEAEEWGVFFVLFTALFGQKAA